MLRGLAIGAGVAMVLGHAAADGAQGTGAQMRRETPAYDCPVVTGVGINTKRRYCDVRIAEVVEDGVRVDVPAHTGQATVRFDLHARFSVGSSVAPQRHDAIVAIVDGEGQVIGRGAVRGELRTLDDLFDRLTAVGARTRLAAAPGRPERITVTVGPGVTAISIVGQWLDVQLPSKLDRFETVGRPIALVSNFEVAYTPAGGR